MANNYIQPGNTITLAAPYQRNTGLGALVGSIFGVALQTVANGVDGEFAIEGVWYLAKLSTDEWAQGDKVYWDNSNKRCDTDPTVGILIGVATEAAANPSASGYVRLNGVAPATAEGAQGAVVTLTDSTGLSATHDDTLAATAALVTLTDNSGGSGAHDDTVADGLTVVAFVAGAFTGAVDGTVEDIAASAGACAGGATPTAAQVDTAIAAAVATIVTGTNLQLAEIKSKVDSLITDVTTQNQNDSDLAQKVIEIVTQLAVTNQNISDIAQKLIQLSTALVAFGAITA